MVRDFLIGQGLSADRTSAKGYGETEPVAANDTDDGRQQNRRTELRFIAATAASAVIAGR